MNAPAITIRALSKQYPSALTPALDGLSLDVPAGAIFGLLGPNGAGKTTTIQILCGLLTPDSGDASVFGLDVQHHNAAIRGRLGLVPQSIALYPALTGWENLCYIAQLYGLSTQQIKQRGGQLLEQLGLTPHAHKRASRYSGGMKRRLNIIVSLLHEPELLILDEPTAGVDVQSRALILDFLKGYRAGGKTIVYTSHLLDEAEQLCDTVAIIDEGRNIATGTPRELIAALPDCRRLEDVFLHYTGFALRE